MGPPGETDSCGPLGGHEQGGTVTAAVNWAWALQEKEIAAVLLVDTSKAVQGQQQSTGHGTSGKTAPPQRSQDQGSRRW